MASPGRRWWDFWLVQAVICYGLYNAFEWMRSQIEGSKVDALIHARHIVSTERLLHIFHEARVEHWVLPCAPACNVTTVSDLQRNAIACKYTCVLLRKVVVPGARDPGSDCEVTWRERVD